MAEMQVYLERFGMAARERLQRLVQEAKAVNPLAPVTVAPPNPMPEYPSDASWPVKAGCSTYVSW